MALVSFCATFLVVFSCLRMVFRVAASLAQAGFTGP